MSDPNPTNLPQPEEGVEPDDLNAGMIVAIGLICTVLLLCSVLGVTALVEQMQKSEINAKVYDVEVRDANDTLNAQEQTLATAAATQKPGVYRIPIDEAKRLVVEELAAKTE